MKKIGIFNPYLETRGGGEKVCLTLAEVLANDKNDVSLIMYKPINLKDLGAYMDVDTSKLKIEIIKLPKITKIVHRLPLLPQGLKNFFSDLTTYWILRRKNYDVFVNNCIDSNLPNPSTKGIYACMFPHAIKRTPTDSILKETYHLILRGLYRLLLHPGKRDAVSTYDVITANSTYSQGYIKKLWDKDSDVLYPICDDIKDGPLKKDKLIMSVGRFFANTEVNHHKRHDLMIKSFVKMKKLIADGWELHLGGSVAEDSDTLKYILDLFKAAEGAPVYFHFNAPRADIRKLFNRSSIYWHATGYGSDPKKYPQKQEHFGITTVESLTAGCIPIVFDSAGQRESVTQNKTGFLWQTPEELQSYTTKVAGMSGPELAPMRTAAMQSAKRFNKQAFSERVATIFAKVLS